MLRAGQPALDDGVVFDRVPGIEGDVGKQPVGQADGAHLASEKNITGWLASAIARATQAASAVLPMPGRPATTIRSPRWAPPSMVSRSDRPVASPAILPGCRSATVSRSMERYAAWPISILAAALVALADAIWSSWLIAAVAASTGAALSAVVTSYPRRQAAGGGRGDPGSCARSRRVDDRGGTRGEPGNVLA